MENRELPVGWAIAPLQAVVEILDSIRVPVNTTEREKRIAGKEKQALYPYYGATGQVGWIDDYLFDEELILLGEDGVPFFDPLKKKAYLVEGKFWVNNHAHVIRPLKGACDPAFLLSYLNQFDYTGYVTGSTRLKLTQAAMRRIAIVLAPYSEQRRIAAKLDTTLAAVDACRQRLDGVAAILKRFRQAVLAVATSGELTREWREENGIEMDTWKGYEFSDLVSESRTGLVRSAAEQHELQDGLVPYLKMDSIGESWGCSYEGLKGVRCEDAERRTYDLAYGDWLFNTRNSLELVGKSCVWEGPEGVVFNNNILRVRFTSKVRPQWVEIYFRSPDGRDMLAGVKSATTSVAAIYQRSLMPLEIQVPSLDEQSEVIDRVETFFTLADQLEARLNTARKIVGRLTPALLSKAFRGELAPQDPDDDPVSVLLERIRTARKEGTAASGTPTRPRRRNAQTSITKPTALTNMLTRNDAPSNHLSTILKECGPLSAEALWSASQLEIDDFYDQLRDEEAQGFLRENRGDSPHSPRLLEPAA
jgi:type I restriction enzyme S subunit